MGNKTLRLTMRLDESDSDGIFRTLLVKLPADYSDIDIKSESQKAVLNAICHGFGFLLGCVGGSLIQAELIDVPIFQNDDDDICEEHRASGLLAED